jgi:hypothetical protein
MGRPLPESVIVQEGDPDFAGAPTAMRFRLTYEGKLLGATQSEIFVYSIRAGTRGSAWLPN